VVEDRPSALRIAALEDRSAGLEVRERFKQILTRVQGFLSQPVGVTAQKGLYLGNSLSIDILTEGSELLVVGPVMANLNPPSRSSPCLWNEGGLQVFRSRDS
jgi:hypothetical protein